MEGEEDWRDREGKKSGVKRIGRRSQRKERHKKAHGNSHVGTGHQIANAGTGR